jgi:hypothetical protein
MFTLGQSHFHLLRLTLFAETTAAVLILGTLIHGTFIMALWVFKQAASGLIRFTQVLANAHGSR